jgi:hypothetical protein
VSLPGSLAEVVVDSKGKHTFYGTDVALRSPSAPGPASVTSSSYTRSPWRSAGVRSPPDIAAGRSGRGRRRTWAERDRQVDTAASDRGLVDISEGEVELFAGADDLARRRIGITLEEPRLWPWMRAHDAIVCIAGLSGVAISGHDAMALLTELGGTPECGRVSEPSY